MNISHPNILQLIAVEIKSQINRFSMVSEIMANGNIVDYIRAEGANSLCLVRLPFSPPRPNYRLYSQLRDVAGGGPCRMTRRSRRREKNKAHTTVSSNNIATFTLSLDASTLSITSGDDLGPMPTDRSCVRRDSRNASVFRVDLIVLWRESPRTYRYRMTWSDSRDDRWEILCMSETSRCWAIKPPSRGIQQGRVCHTSGERPANS